jgi:protein TonB
MSDSELDADLSATRGTKAGVFVLVALLHVVAVLALIRAFAPDFTQKAVEQVVSAFTVTITTPEPSPTPPPPPPRPEPDAGAAGNVGKKAKPKEVIAPKPKVVIAKQVAPAAASTGNAVTSGARDNGLGTGAGGQGNGTGSGAGGNGSGGGRATKFTMIAGRIDSARDYPAASRDLRLGKSVTIVFTVGTDGRVHNCRVRDASGDPQADAITCRLATERFRFKPSLDAAGNPIEDTYGWRQRWYAPN